MKRALLTALLGFATVVTAHAQGFIIFDNYDSTPYMRVQSVTPLGPNVHVDLLYYLGTTANPSQLTDLGLSVPIDPTLVDSLPAANHGYFKGGVVKIPGYLSGPVTFEVEGWDTTSGLTYAAAGLKGASQLWQESSLATTGLPVEFFQNLPGPNGSTLLFVTDPEPSVYALSTLAGACLMFIRRKKNRPHPEVIG
jgi:hypothetical protein